MVLDGVIVNNVGITTSLPHCPATLLLQALVLDDAVAG
jgi:hypothetical protein